jgi:chemotaxis response regulator CheB
MRELLIETIVEQPDIEVLAEIQNEPDIYRIVDEKRPDILIIALDSDVRPTICDTLLQQFPSMKILAVSPDRNSSIFYWVSMDIHESQVEVSEAGILSTLRGKGSAYEVKNVS